MRKEGKDSSRQTARTSSLGVEKNNIISSSGMIGWNSVYLRLCFLQDFPQTSKHNMLELFGSNRGDLIDQHPQLLTLDSGDAFGEGFYM